MVGRVLDADQLANVLDDGALANELLWDEDEDGYGDEVDGRLDLDKAWHGVHYLLTGTAWEAGDPLAAAVLGGREVGDDDGYGPPRLLEADLVRTVADALAAVDDADLRARFDPAEMQRLDIYPQVWDEDGILDDYLMPNVDELRRFYAGAAAAGAAVLLCMQ